MAEDGILQQETEGQNSTTSSIDENRSLDEAQNLTKSESRRKKWESHRALVLTIECLQFDLEFKHSDGATTENFYEAVRKGKLDEVKQLLSITLLRTRFTQLEANAFQVAVVAGQKDMFRELMKYAKDDGISILKEKNDYGETILTLAVAQGSIEIVKELLDTCVELVDIPNKKGELPVTVAALLGNKEIVTFLFTLTMGLFDWNPSGGDVEEDVVVTNSTQSSQDDKRNYSFKLVSEDRDQAEPAYQSRRHCLKLFKACIRSKIYDVAFEVFRIFPRVCIEEMAKEDGKTVNSLVVAIIELRKQRNFVVRFLESCLERWGESCKLCSWFERYWKLLLERTAKSRYENNYKQTMGAELLLGLIFLYMWKLEIPGETVHRVLTRAIITAVEQGDNTIFTDKIRTLNFEIPSDDFTMSIPALKNPATGLLRAIHGDTNGNTILHHVALFSSAKKLTSPSLQMQIELQWFKKVGKIVPWCIAVENNDNLTPWNLFVEQHRNLKNEGEKWLKETASSCSILAVLIVTVMFSAAFTVPGGYENDTGRPVYLGSKYFTVFIISDALSLLFSSTSAMVFLGFYTLLFREEDFLKRLPITLICGLFTLFLSITTMVTAFSAALILTLREDFVWITLPVLMSASIPVIIYSVLNIPIFVNVLYSTLFSH